MMRLQLVQIDKLAHKLSLRIAQIAAVGVVIMMLLVTLEVFLRKVFNTSTHVAHEYSGYLLALLIFWGAAEALVEGKHIRVTLIIDCLKRGDRISGRMGHVIAVAFVLVLLWASTILVVSSYTIGSMSTGVYQIPLFIPQLVIPVGLFFFMVQLIANLVREFKC